MCMAWEVRYTLICYSPVMHHMHRASHDDCRGRVAQRILLQPLKGQKFVIKEYIPEKPSIARRPFHFSAKGVKGPTERESGFSPASQQPCVSPPYDIIL